MKKRTTRYTSQQVIVIHMDLTPDDTTRQGPKGAEAARKTNEERWTKVAEETALTKRQLAMWELADHHDLKQMWVAREYDIKESTVSRHIERVREKRDQIDEKIEELENELQRWRKTKEYFDA